MKSGYSILVIGVLMTFMFSCKTYSDNRTEKYDWWDEDFTYILDGVYKDSYIPIFSFYIPQSEFRYSYLWEGDYDSDEESLFCYYTNRDEYIIVVYDPEGKYTQESLLERMESEIYEKYWDKHFIEGTRLSHERKKIVDQIKKNYKPIPRNHMIRKDGYSIFFYNFDLIHRLYIMRLVDNTFNAMKEIN